MKPVNSLQMKLQMKVVHANKMSDEWDPQFIYDFPELKLVTIRGTFPNGNVHMSDKPHSAKQILSRCFNGIKCINEVFHRMIRSRSSPSNMIHNSPAFQEQYSDQMLEEQIWRSKKLKDLGMSNMKFNIVGRPLARMALKQHATCSQMQLIIDTRGPSSV